MSQPPAPGPLGMLRLGGFLVACILGGIGLGYVVDLLVGTTPLFLFVGLVLGIVSACAGSWRTVRDSLKQQ